jgi:hypothetical protein
VLVDGFASRYWNPDQSLSTHRYPTSNNEARGLERLRRDRWKHYWITRQSLTRSMVKAVKGLLAENLG